MKQSFCPKCGVTFPTGTWHRTIVDGKIVCDTEPDSRWVTLAECPVGLFLSQTGELCLKTDYRTNEGQIDAYYARTGEYFWGSGSDLDTSPARIVNQRKELVRPIDSNIVHDYFKELGFI